MNCHHPDSRHVSHEMNAIDLQMYTFNGKRPLSLLVKEWTPSGLALRPLSYIHSYSTFWKQLRVSLEVSAFMLSDLAP